MKRGILARDNPVDYLLPEIARLDWEVSRGTTTLPYGLLDWEVSGGRQRADAGTAGLD